MTLGAPVSERARGVREASGELGQHRPERADDRIQALRARNRLAQRLHDRPEREGLAQTVPVTAKAETADQLGAVDELLDEPDLPTGFALDERDRGPVCRIASSSDARLLFPAD
jgi:hypothetical protein